MRQRKQIIGAIFITALACGVFAAVLVHAVWFGAGLRIIDMADPSGPREVGFFIPEPVGGKSAPQSNDVVLDERGLIYIVDRLNGFDVLEFSGD